MQTFILRIDDIYPWQMLREHLEWFPVAAVTDDHKLSGFNNANAVS